MTESSFNNNKALENLNEKVLELINDKGVIAKYLASFLDNLFEPENKSQFKILKDHNSIRMKEFLTNRSVPVTLYSNLLIFRDSNRSFKRDVDLLETMTNFDFNVYHSNPHDWKLFFDFAKETKINIRQKARKSPRDESVIRSLKSPTIMTSGISTMFLPVKPNELCDTLKILLQEKQAGNNSDTILEEIIAIVDKLLG